MHVLIFLRRFVDVFVLRRGFAVLAMALVLTAMGCARNGALKYAILPSNTCDVLQFSPGDPECLPLPGFFCVDAPEGDMATALTPDPRYIGQIFPSKQVVGPNVPVCPPNATRLLEDEDIKRVRKGAHDIGKQVGVVMTHCEQILEGLTRYPDGTIRNWYLTNPESMEVVLKGCADDLDKIETIPEFEDPWLAGTAVHAFEEGYGAGVDEVHNRLFLIELAIDTIEMIVLPELMLAEVVLTRAIRTSVAGLRRMPIFIPGAVGGLGAAMRLGTKAVVKTVAKGSSRALAKALKLAGKIRLPGEFTHHIVAHGDQRAAKSLEILDKFGIKVDDAVNGVFLPGFKTSPNPMGKIVHGNVHTNAYYVAVEEALKGATTQAQVIQRLRLIAWKLEHGIMP